MLLDWTLSHLLLSPAHSALLFSFRTRVDVLCLLLPVHLCLAVDQFVLLVHVLSLSLAIQP